MSPFVCIASSIGDEHADGDNLNQTLRDVK